MADSDHDAHCCAPSRNGSRNTIASSTASPKHGPSGALLHGITQSMIPTGTFLMGDSTGNGNYGDGETPVHEVEVDAFVIDSTSVTNEQFDVFTAETGYRTEAEAFGFSAVFHLALETDQAHVMSSAGSTPWWLGVHGADWAHPGGPGSDISALAEHPAVHISWNDAAAYCDWADRRLPTEAEWERASRGDLEGRRYPWGDILLEEGTDTWRCNIWQGRFPVTNTVEDGWLTTSPVHSYAPQRFRAVADGRQRVGVVFRLVFARLLRALANAEPARPS